jgi:hypothetical protein
LKLPYSLARNRVNKNICITCAAGDSIVEYPDGSIVARGNGRDNGIHQLNNPEGLAYDEVSDSFSIGNSGVHTIFRWRRGAKNGTLLFGVPGVAGSIFTLFNRTINVAIDPLGNGYVADSYNHRIQLFMNGETEDRTIIGSTGIGRSNATLLKPPSYVKLDEQLNVYVSDHGQRSDTDVFSLLRCFIFVIQ